MNLMVLAGIVWFRQLNREVRWKSGAVPPL